jgi:phosphate transport system substrate-binding protein
MSSQLRLSLFLTLGLMLSWLASSSRAIDPELIKATQEWTGSTESELLEKIVPQFLTTQEGFGILWKAWALKGNLPEVDFTESIIVISTTRGSRLNVSYSLDEKDNLQVNAISTRDLRPGFRYHVAVVPRAGVVSVSGVELPPIPRLVTEVTPVLKPYSPEAKLIGELQFEGSSTMSHLMETWSAEFRKFHPKLKISHKSDGSETADPEYANGKATIAFVSRPVGIEELGAWEQKTKLRMMAFPVCEDDIALIVHNDNPLKQVNTLQLKRVFSEPKQRPTWGFLGLEGDWATKQVTLHGRDENSGTRRFLKNALLGAEGTDFVSKSHKSYSSIVTAVAADPSSMGYVRDVFVKEGVRAVPIVVGKKTQPYLRRTCSLVVAVPKGNEIPPLVKEFLVFMYRREAQESLFHDGFHPLSKQIVNLQLERLGVEEIK